MIFWHDEAIGRWAVRNGDKQLYTEKLEIETQCYHAPDPSLGYPAGALICGPQAVRGDTELFAMLSQPEPLDGVINYNAMREWAVVFDASLGKWAVFTLDGEFNMVTSDIEINVHHAITKGREIHMQAECLINGMSCTRAIQTLDARTVKLRTLVVHDQFVKVPPITMRMAIQRPG